MTTHGAAVDLILDDVRAELNRAVAKFAPIHSPHEGFAVIAEELDELWDEVKGNRGRDEFALGEALQVAAMAVRYILDMTAIPDDVS